MQSFQFTSFTFDEKTGTLLLNYACGAHVFQEQVVFPGAPFDKARVQSMHRVFFWTHIALGISYYKAFCPPEIEILSGLLSETEAAFFDRFYLAGLGEFAVRNGLNLQGKIHFPFGQSTKPVPVGDLKDEAYVAVGGGKDSCVTIELLKSFHPVLFSVGTAEPIEKCVRASGLPFVQIKRTLSPVLLELNGTGTVYNGHVPISGMIAFLSLCLALLNRKRFVVLSNERSANVGNMNQGDLSINHQWSKSFEFEQAFYQMTQTVAPDFRYFSLLRPLSELHIAKLFAQKCTAYHSIFTSCNKAFKLDLTKRLTHWCGSCDKCRFVFLILAPFMDKEKWTALFGSDPLNDPAQEEGYRELLGLSGHKPFECVGEGAECRRAWTLLRRHPAWRQDVLLQKIAVDQEEGDLFQPSAVHLIPKEFQDAFDRFTA